MGSTVAQELASFCFLQALWWNATGRETQAWRKLNDAIVYATIHARSWRPVARGTA